MRPAKTFLLGFLLVAAAGGAWLLVSGDIGAMRRPSSAAASAIQSLDGRESGGTWIVRGKLDEADRLQLLRKGVRCYQFDSRSW